jgi:diketogulonate reductase-like aldo/keto reductase
MTQESHLAENMEIFDFNLSSENIKRINSLNKNARFYDRVPVEKYNWVPIAV